MALRRKKIAIVITRMIPGGASNIVKKIIDGGHGTYDFTLFTGMEDIDSSEMEGLEAKYNAVLIPSLVRKISPFYDFSAFRWLLREFRRTKFDVVHTHTSKAGVIGRAAAHYAKGIPNIIHTPHGTIYTPNGNIPGVPDLGFYKKMLIGADRVSGRWGNFLTVLSRNEYDISVKLGLSAPLKTVIIPNGIELSKFQSNSQRRIESRNSLGLSEDELLILCVGRIADEKGHSVLIEAFRKLLSMEKCSQKVRLGIVGDGPLKETLEKANGDLVRTGKLVFYGHANDVSKYLSASDIFVLPSFYEGFGIAALEAMAAGLPVIASEVGGLPELLENNLNGYLVPAGNPCRFCDAMYELISKHDLIVEMGNANRIKANNFTFDKMLDKYYELYERQ